VKRIKTVGILLLLLMCFLAACNSAETEPLPSTAPTETQTLPLVITENELGALDGYDYELRKDMGTTEMTLNGGGTYSCQWEEINNALFRIGRKYDCTKSWEDIGDIQVNYGADYYPVGNSYLCIYGWTREPLVEYYIVQSWGNWRPPVPNPSEPLPLTTVPTMYM